LGVLRKNEGISAHSFSLFSFFLLLLSVVALVFDWFKILVKAVFEENFKRLLGLSYPKFIGRFSYAVSL
jgi:hypothetical protein